MWNKKQLWWIDWFNYVWVVSQKQYSLHKNGSNSVRRIHKCVGYRCPIEWLWPFQCTSLSIPEIHCWSSCSFTFSSSLAIRLCSYELERKISSAPSDLQAMKLSVVQARAWNYGATIVLFCGDNSELILGNRTINGIPCEIRSTRSTLNDERNTYWSLREPALLKSNSMRWELIIQLVIINYDNYPFRIIQHSKAHTASLWNSQNVHGYPLHMLPWFGFWLIWILHSSWQRDIVSNIE